VSFYQVIQIDGFLKAVTQDNYRNMTDDLDVAYMSCDESNDNDRDPNEILNGLMSLSPMAIVLYSTSMNWCSLSFDGPLSYTSILSMVDPGEATTVLGHLNETNNGDMVGVSIFGNATSGIDNDGHRGNRSTIAMSVLYSITGVITLLFLAIITTGAVRAHRYPERYGPRRAQGGQPRQSRAKGLARAVLETIPIVKFGDKKPPKPDPDLEMETATTDDRDVTAQRSLPLHGERMSMQAAGGTSLDNISRSERASVSPEESEKQLGCSICTEDFQVGEDVRVLPCDHQYHPNCIDPWLINVSGTCPLWYVAIIPRIRTMWHVLIAEQSS
jgi:hypothetical protein